MIIFFVYFNTRLISISTLEAAMQEPKNQGKPAQHSGRDDGTYERKAGSLDAEQPRAQSAEPAALDKRGYAGCEQRHRNQVAGGFRIELQCARNDERRGDDGYEYGEQMLQRAKKASLKGRLVVQAVNQSVSLLFFHRPVI